MNYRKSNCSYSKPHADKMMNKQNNPPYPTVPDPPREGEDEGEGDRRTLIPDKDHDDKTKPEVARANLFSAAR